MNQIDRLRSYTTMLVALTLSTSALAQTAAEQQLPEVKVQGATEATGYNPPTATSATKIEAPLRDIPQTVNVVPQELIRDQAARSMQDTLKNIPGIGLSSGDGQRDQVSIRGFSAISDQFIDGLRDDALYFRDLSNIERVEVLKGPASVLYGRGSSGGLINRVTRKPGIDLMHATVQIGSWDARRGELDVARTFQQGGVSFRVTGAIERGESYRNQQFLEREAIAPSFAFRPGPDTELLVQGERLNDRRLTDFGIPSFRGRPVNVPASTYYGAANARAVDVSAASVSALGFTLTHRINAEWSLRNALRGYGYELDRHNTLPGTVNESAQTVTLNHSTVKRREAGIFNQTELVQKTRFGSMDHQLLYGVELGRQRKDQYFATRNGVATVSLFNPILPVLPLEADVAPSSNNVGVMTVMSGYVQDLVSLSERWKALAGVRYDVFEQETKERIPGRVDLSRTDRALSPRVGVVYQPTLAQSYYAAYSKSFQPSAEAFPLAANNAQIAPEETTHREIGAKLDFFEGYASATASLFRLARTNIKFVDPTTNTLIPVGVQRTDGLELSFSGRLPQGWEIYSGYAYLDSRVISSVAIDAGQLVEGKRATITPLNSANVWLTKNLGGGFGAGGGVTYVGDRYANPGNTVTLPEYVTFDAVAWYRARRYDVQLNAYNLFDRRYIVAGHGSAPNLNLPGAPRSAVLTVRFRI
ncbi:MAG TPA: TonB-dependent siderophore receptor [Burkholderiales bacterium]|nr:TonB-dependent siderophore receptor [Burkholderiales bacterium]